MAKGKMPAGLTKFMASKKKGGGKKTAFGGEKAAPFKKKGK